MRRRAVCAAGGTCWPEGQGSPQGGRARAVDRPRGPRRPSGGARAVCRLAVVGRSGWCRCCSRSGGACRIRGAAVRARTAHRARRRGPKRGAAVRGYLWVPAVRVARGTRRARLLHRWTPAPWGLSWPSLPLVQPCLLLW